MVRVLTGGGERKPRRRAQAHVNVRSPKRVSLTGILSGGSVRFLGEVLGGNRRRGDCDRDTRGAEGDETGHTQTSKV